MPRVLIATDEIGGLGDLVQAYGRLGYEVAVGKTNFFIHASHYDILQLAWPEEFSNWQVPSDETIGEIERDLNEWKRSSKLIFFANNLYPHGYEGHSSFQRLYDVFYRLADVVVHYSETSRELSLKEYPSARAARHCVTTMFGYHKLIPQKTTLEDRGKSDDRFRILVFGALRSKSELDLIRGGFEKAKLANKQLVMAGRYNERIGPWKLRWNRANWKLWLWRTKADRRVGYTPDAELWELFRGSDVVVVPRIKDMNSGVIGLAMTFGRMIVAPKVGAFPDQIGKSGNLLYEPGNAESLAACLEEAARMDRSSVEKRNREEAKSWTWDAILAKALAAVK